jgi:hypothetical protein
MRMFGGSFRHFGLDDEAVFCGVHFAVDDTECDLDNLLVAITDLYVPWLKLFPLAYEHHGSIFDCLKGRRLDRDVYFFGGQSEAAGDEQAGTQT